MSRGSLISARRSSNLIRSFATTPCHLKPATQHPDNNISKIESLKLSQKLSNIPPYGESQLQTIESIKVNNVKIGALSKFFKEIGFVPTEDHKFTEIDLKRVRNELSSLDEASLDQGVKQPFKKVTRILEQPTRSKTQSYQMSTLYDFIHHTQIQTDFFTQSPQFKKRFEYLENAIYAPNKLNSEGEPIKFISLDIKSKNSELREIGLSIYTPPKPQDLPTTIDTSNSKSSSSSLTPSYLSTSPDIKTYHIIVEEYFGILSKNHYTELPSIKLPLREAIKFMKTTLEDNLSFHNDSAAGNKLVGYNVANLLKILKQLDITIPMRPDTVIDILNLYMTPFLYKESPVKNSKGKQNNEYLRILPFFMRFESILNRFGLLSQDHKLNFTNPANRSRYALLVFHKLVNPYVRVEYKLDDFKSNWKYMKDYLNQQINLILAKSGSVHSGTSALNLNDRDDAIRKSIDRTNKLIRELELKAEKAALKPIPKDSNDSSTGISHGL